MWEIVKDLWVYTFYFNYNCSFFLTLEILQLNNFGSSVLPWTDITQENVHSGFYVCMHVHPDPMNVFSGWQQRDLYRPPPLFFFTELDSVQRFPLKKAALSFYESKVIPFRPWLMGLRHISKHWKWRGFPVELEPVKKQDVSVHFSKYTVCRFACQFVGWGVFHPGVFKSGHCSCRTAEHGIAKKPLSKPVFNKSEKEWEGFQGSSFRLELLCWWQLSHPACFGFQSERKGLLGSLNFLGMERESLKFKLNLKTHLKSRQVALFQI